MTSAVQASAGLQALRTLRRLVTAARSTTNLLEVRDNESKQDLLDSLALAELSVLRMLADEGE
ncbi:MAG: hypothetical protein R3C25_11785 [Hyphomonadaceae bacterium]